MGKTPSDSGVYLSDQYRTILIEREEEEEEEKKRTQNHLAKSDLESKSRWANGQ